MAMPECHLVRDLLIPYMAGEVSPQTLAYMNEHLGRCPECRAALAALNRGTAPVAPPPTPMHSDPGRKLVGRVRRQVTLIAVLIVASVALAVGGIVWGVTAARQWMGNPERHPAPAYSVTPEEAAEVDLGGAGLKLTSVTSVREGALAQFTDADGHVVELQFFLLSSPYRAREAFKDWNNTFRVKLASVETNFESVAMARFRSGGHYYYGWFDGRWFFTIDVPESVEDPAGLRTTIFNELSKAWVR